MKIEMTTLLELDEDLERKRLRQAFKGQERKTQEELFEAFVAQDWDRADSLHQKMTREQREGVHPIIHRVLEKLRTRKALSRLGDDYFDRMPEPERMFGSISGMPVSRDGLCYPKFRVLPPAEQFDNSPVRKALRAGASSRL